VPAPAESAPAKEAEPIEEKDTVFTPLPPKVSAAPVERVVPAERVERPEEPESVFTPRRRAGSDLRGAPEGDAPQDGESRQVGASGSRPTL
jgi:hypothetical protein